MEMEGQEHGMGGEKIGIHVRTILATPQPPSGQLTRPIIASTLDTSFLGGGGGEGIRSLTIRQLPGKAETFEVLANDLYTCFVLVTVDVFGQ